MELQDLAPKSIRLVVGNGLELTFRPFTIADDLKSFEDHGGPEALTKKFEEFDFAVISRVAWHQLTLECQKEVIKAVSLSSLDPDTGEEVERCVSPLAKFRGLFAGIGEQSQLYATLVRCKGLNLPDITDEDGLKKFLDQMQKARA